MTTHEPAPLTLEEEGTEEVRRLHITGGLDLATAPILVGTLDKMVAQRLGTIVLDLDGVEFVDSYGLSAIVDAHRRIEAAGGHLRVGRTSEPARRLLEMTGLLDPLHYAGDSSDPS